MENQLQQKLPNAVEMTDAYNNIMKYVDKIPDDVFKTAIEDDLTNDTSIPESGEYAVDTFVANYDGDDTTPQGTGTMSNPVKLNENNSKRFESRFSTIKINKNKSIFFKDMEDTIFGIWVAHREGRFSNTSRLPKNQICLQYYHNNQVTNNYPHNPNGSEQGIAGICSNDGRHTILMPHPERCFLKWQLPYCNKYQNIQTSPWIYMFKNSYEWCKNPK